jgi:hypothetical protein
MARVVQQLQQRQGLRPTVNARAADSYVRQLPNIVGRPDMKTGAWSQLAQALSTVEPKLTRFLDGKHEEWKSDQLAEGVALFQKNRMDWKAFTEANPDFAGANPHLQRGYTLAWLQNKGLDFESELNGWWEDNRNKVDPNDLTALNKGMNEFSKQWMEREFGESKLDDDLLAEGLQKPMHQALSSILSRHNQWRMAANTERAKTELGGFVNRMADKYSLSGDWETSSGIVQSARGLASQIQTQLDEMIANGLSATEANRLVVDELASVAREYNNAEIMQTLDYVVTARNEKGEPIATLGGGGYGAKIREQIEDLIENQQIKQWDFERRREAHVKEQQANSLMSQIQMQMLDNPAADYTQNDLYRQLTRLDPAKARSMIGFQDRVISAQSTKFTMNDESLQTAADYRLRIAQFDISPDEIREGLMTKYDYATFKALMDDYDSTMRYENQLRDSAVNGVANDIYRVVGMADEAGLVSPENQLRAVEARNYFHDSLMSWMDQYTEEHNGNTPSPREVRLRAYELEEDILKMKRFQNEDGTRRPVESPQTIRQELSRDQFIQALNAYSDGDVAALTTLAQQAGVNNVNAYIAQQAQALGLEQYIRIEQE